MSRRTTWLRVGTALIVLMASCSSDGAMTITEYAETTAEMTNVMNRQLDVLDANAARNVTVAGEQLHWSERAKVRRTFLDAFLELDPPAEAEDLHETVAPIVTRLTEAEEAIAARLETVVTMEELVALEDSPEFTAHLAIDDEAIAICRAALEEFDSPDDVVDFPDIPWVPDEMADVVDIWFGCTIEDRG